MSNNNDFDTPAAAGGTNLQWDTLDGALIIIQPQAVETITTSFGDRETVRATLTVVDSDQAGIEYDDALIFPKVLVSQLKSKIGKKVLGRVGQGNKKPGQNAPWILNDPTPDDIEAAKAHEAKANPYDSATAQPPF